MVGGEASGFLPGDAGSSPAGSNCGSSLMVKHQVVALNMPVRFRPVTLGIL